MEPYSIHQKKIDNDIYVLVFEIFAKLTYKNQKNQEYFIKKNGYRLLEPFSKMNPSQLNVLRPLYSILINCCDQNDYQLIFWCNGFVAQVIKKKNELIEKLKGLVGNNAALNEKEINQLLSELEIYLLFLSKASYECEEIILTLTNEKTIYDDTQFLINLVTGHSLDSKFYLFYLKLSGISLNL